MPTIGPAQRISLPYKLKPEGDVGLLTIFNVYNECENDETEKALDNFLVSNEWLGNYGKLQKLQNPKETGEIEPDGPKIDKILQKNMYRKDQTQCYDTYATVDYNSAVFNSSNRKENMSDGPFQNLETRKLTLVPRQRQAGSIKTNIIERQRIREMSDWALGNIEIRSIDRNHGVVSSSGIEVTRTRLGLCRIAAKGENLSPPPLANKVNLFSKHL
ncbi:hypothetical protein CPC08DRAFT_719800 [Agrocybe pediades]|nr:hypothetical protein CPC08DRAFT_719800 [Agrocybe pediades]